MSRNSLIATQSVLISAIQVFGNEAALRYSIALSGAILLPTIVVILMIGMPIYRRSLDQRASA